MRPAGPRSATVFLSHAGRDRDVAERLADRLRRSGLDVWLDVHALRPGDPWMEAIERALEAADAFLLLVGAAGVDRWVGMEARVALERAVRGPLRIVPVLGPGAEGPETLPAFLRVYQALDLRTAEAPLQPLLDALDVARPAAPVLPAGEPPFKGLDAFDGSDAHLFFGRDREVEAVLERLQAHPALTVIGDSGTGKSSLVRAGVVPALHAGRFAEEGRWVDAWWVGVCRPGAEPVARLAGALTDVTHPGLPPGERERVRGTVLDLLERGPAGVDAVLGGMPEGRRHLLVVDQFEEVFTQAVDPERRAAFFDLLVRLPSPAVRVVLTLRADFYDECWEHRDLLEMISRHQYALPHMAADQLRDVIEKPLALAGLRMEEGLAAAIVDETGDGAGSLAVVQHALLELWRARTPDGILTHASYASMGRLRGAIGTHAEAVYEALDERQKALAERVFERLADPRRRDVRRPAPTDDLLALGPPDAMKALLERLVRGRLVVARRQGDLEFWEVAHEALIDHWPRYRAWLESQQAFYTWLELLRSQVEGWERVGRHRSALLQGRPLREAARWQKTHAAYLDDAERAFLVACRQRLRRRRAGWAVAGLALLSAGGLGMRQLQANEAARRAADVRDGARLTAAADPLAAALALAEIPARWAGPEARQLLADVTGLELPERRWAAHDGAVAALLPWGLRDEVVSVGMDGRVLLWRFDGGAPDSTTLARHRGAVVSASPTSGGGLVTAGADGAVRVLGAGGGVVELDVPSAIGAVGLASGRVVTRSGDRLRLWAGGVASDLPGPGESVGALAALPGDRVAVGTPSGRVLVGAAAGGGWRLLTTHPSGVGALEAEPVTGTVLSAARDGSARLTPVDGGASLTLPHAAEVTAHTLAALATGLVVTGTADGSVRLWSVPAPGAGPATVVARADLGVGAGARRVTSVAASPAGDVVVAGSASGGLALWRRGGDGRVVGRSLAGRGVAVTAVAVLPGGRAVVAAFDDGLMASWRVPGRLEGMGDVRAAADLGSGALVLATDTALLRLDAGEALPTLLWRHAGITGVVAAADGSVLAVRAGDSLHRVDPRSGTVQASAGAGPTVSALAAGPDGAFVAADVGRGVRVWNARGAVAARLPGPVSTLRWRDDGTLLLTGDTALWRWDPRDGALATVAALEDGVLLDAADLDATGGRIVLGTDEGGVRLRTAEAEGSGAERRLALPAPVNPACGGGARFAAFLPGDAGALVGTRGGLWRWRPGEGEADTVALEVNDRDRCIRALAWGPDRSVLASLPLGGGGVVVHGIPDGPLRLAFPDTVRGAAFRDGNRRILAWTSARELHERPLTWEGMVADLHRRVAACLTAKERQVLLKESYRRASARAECRPGAAPDEREGATP